MEKELSFQLPATDGTTISLEDFRGKAGVLVVFTCNHCPYAVAYEQRLIDLTSKYADQGVAVVAISSNNVETHPQDGFDAMKLRAQQRGFNFPYMYDESQQVALNYGAQRTPHVFLLNGDLQMVYSGAIDDNYERPEAVQDRFVENAIDALLAGNAQPVASTTPVGCSIKWKPENIPA